MLTEYLGCDYYNDISMRTENLSVSGVLETQARCAHFGVCGGCSSQNLNYEEQLRLKENRLRSLLDPFSPQEFRPIVASPDIWFYRNKVEMIFASGKNGARLALRQRGSFKDYAALDECVIFHEKLPSLIEAVNSWARTLPWPVYDLKTHEGFLRYLVARVGKNTGEALINLVTHELPQGFEGVAVKESFLASLRAAGWGQASVVWVVNREKADVSFGEIREVWQGQGSFGETFLGRGFEVGPFSFIQTNTKAAEVLYEIVGKFLGDFWPAIADLYSGIGIMSVLFAGKAKQVIGVESLREAVYGARFNAQANNAGNVSFFAQRVEETDVEGLLKTFGFVAQDACLILDPPRAGTHPKALKEIVGLGAPRAIYVSCNPEALARDLVVFKESGYQLKSVCPIDLFPHTDHVEVAACLDRQ